MAVYGYTRVSTVEQADGSSLADQARKIDGVAMIRGEGEPTILTDAGVSGSVALEQRPAGSELLGMLRAGDTLIVAKLDRAFRNATDALAKADQFKARGVKLIIADIGTEPVTQNGVGKMFFGMLALMAEFERERILERTSDGRKAKRQAGGHTGGSAPFGYQVEGLGRDAKLIPVEAEQRGITLILQLHGQGKGSRYISEVLEDTLGLKLSHVGVTRVIKREMPVA